MHTLKKPNKELEMMMAMSFLAWLTPFIVACETKISVTSYKKTVQRRSMLFVKITMNILKI